MDDELVNEIILMFIDNMEDYKFKSCDLSI